MDAALQLVAFYFASALPSDDPGVASLVWGALGVVSCASLVCYILVAWRILTVADKKVFAYMLPKQGRAEAEAVVTTHLEYDMRRLSWVVAREALSAAFLVVVGRYFGTLTPAIIASVTAPYHLVCEPLVELHLLGAAPRASLRRPFQPKPSGWKALLGGSLADALPGSHAEPVGGGVKMKAAGVGKGVN